MLDLSIIIPAVNEAADIASCVRTSLVLEPREVIVVDGGSSDATAELAAASGATVLHSPPGRAVQQNAGAEHATGRRLLFLHADCWLSPSAIMQLEECDAPSHAFCAFRQQIDATGLKYRLLEQGNALRVRLQGMVYGDQAICVTRELFKRVGGFEEVPLMEDVRFSRAARKQCWPKLLKGPVIVDARRWKRDGVSRRTLANWRLLWAEQRGADLHELAASYRRHDHDE